MGRYDSYTKVLLHMNGADASQTFTDEIGKTWTAYGDAQIDTAQSKFGGASGLFNGSTDYVTTPNSTDFNFGTGDFTIDFWLRRDGAQAGYAGIINASTHTGIAGWSIGLGDGETANKIILATDWGGETFLQAIISSSTLADATWTHVAVVRSSNTVTMYFDGTSVGTWDTAGLSINSSGVGAMIGRAHSDLGPYYKGHIDEMRISKGIARWTANFTPPIRAYPPLGGLFTFHG